MIRSAAAAVALIGVIVAANWLTSTYGLIPAGFGLLVTAGTFAAGLALALRDVVHESGGVPWVLGTIAAGCTVSYLLGDGRIAIASAAAFLVAELIDLAVYAPLRRRRWRTAVAASGATGAIVDTLLFLSIAGFPVTTATIAGQLLVKSVWVTAGFLLVAELIRRTRRRPAEVTDRAVPGERVIAEGA